MSLWVSKMLCIVVCCELAKKKVDKCQSEGYPRGNELVRVQLNASFHSCDEQ